jgi:hypothetical protein
VNLHALACLLPLPLPTQLHCNSVTAMEPPCCACSSRRETQQCEPASRVAQIYSEVNEVNENEMNEVNEVNGMK